ncbi:branched-chain amino acid ABC-type transport system, permease component [Pseudomonas sp. GM21]|uniref:ABC transporter permease subunit n=1 Tax=Pseudomonas sp. GM21 TaxID=1144325 RepID=UPI0002723599|nr:branched-chain amino acid ABC-type transport system, permease component [Pseudomonas sp. GM21]
MDSFIQQLLNGLMTGSLYALVALVYSMVYGILRIINFAHGDVLMIGALVGLWVIRLLQAAWPELPPVLMLLVAKRSSRPTRNASRPISSCMHRLPTTV